MRLKIVYFLSLLFAALAFVPTGAHLLELPNKISLSRSDYLVVQQNYAGWALLGIVVFGALISSLVLTIMLRGTGRAFYCSLAAFLCIVGTQVIFWTYTFPANQATANWTMLPNNWIELRRNWEYSHAASGVLNFAAMVLLILSGLIKSQLSPVLSHDGTKMGQL